MIPWDEHFRKASRKPTMNIHSVDFGSFLGTHTVGELRDLVKAYDSAFNQIEQKAQDLPATDPATAEWLSDWMTLRERYLYARGRAQKVIDEWSVKPDSVRTAESEYQGILRALQRNEDAYETGDYQDLYNRMATLLGEPPAISMPQPTATDFDQELIVATTGVSDSVDSALHPFQTLEDRFKKHPIQTLAIGVASLFGAKILLKFLL